MPEHIYLAQVTDQLAVQLNPVTGEVQLRVTAPMALREGDTFVIDAGDRALPSALNTAFEVARQRGLRSGGRPIGRDR